MLETDNIEIALRAFRDKVIREAKMNLRNRNKVSSGRLYKSIRGSKIRATNRSLQFNIEMEDYGTFIDKGVSGVKRKFNTPYTYRDKMPPPSSLDNWIVRKGIAPRDEKGKFIKRKSLQFLIARGIYNNGIKPSLFFTTPFKKYAKSLPDILEKAFALDTEELLEYINKQNFK